jgi:hypothetical protein
MTIPLSPPTYSSTNGDDASESFPATLQNVFTAAWAMATGQMLALVKRR